MVIVTHVFVDERNHCRNRQNHEEHGFQRMRIQHQYDFCRYRGADKRPCRRQQPHGDIHHFVAVIPQGGDCRAAGGCKFIAGIDHVDGQTTDEVGGNGNQTAAPCNGIQKACQKACKHQKNEALR